MIQVQVSELKPGMKLAKDITLADGRLLLLAGFAIKRLYIRKLESFKVQFVYIEEGPYEQAEEEYTEEKLYKEAYSTVKKVFSFVRDNKTADILEVQKTVNEITRMILSDERILLQLTGVRDIDNYTFLHSVDVCIYSIVLGKQLGFSTEQLRALGMGAILHDIGKCKIPLSILQKPGKLTDREFAEMKLHTIYGCEIVKSVYGLDSKIANVAYQHHEKWDGTGYPLGIKSEAIDPFSRIVAIADIYDALTADRVYKKKVLPHIAAGYIKNNAATLFDPYIVDLFISNIAVYTEGTVVLLNTGEVGIVLKTEKSGGDRLKLKIIANKSGPPVLSPYSIDLSDFPEKEISEIFI